MITLRHIVYGQPNDKHELPVISDQSVRLDNRSMVSIQFPDPDTQRTFTVDMSVEQDEPVPQSTGKIHIRLTETECGDWRISCFGTGGDYGCHVADYITRDAAFENALAHIQSRHVKWILS